MDLIVCICDYWSRREYFQFDSSDKAVKKLPTPLPYTTLKRFRLVVDDNASWMIKELTQFPGIWKWIHSNPALRGLQLLWIELVPPKKEFIDFKWNRMVACSLWEQIEIEHLMSWLSTLGGGFSALGEQFSRCAETAGKISLKQLSVGIKLGDPFLQTRCKLYYSISLIQTGRLRAAKYLIRQQYEFAKKHKETDKRLVKMCKGIWLRLQYEYGLRLEEKRKKQLLGAGDSH